MERPYYLKRAMESVLKQTYQPLEIIVGIDGKSSITIEMADFFINEAEIHIQWIETNKKSGR